MPDLLYVLITAAFFVAAAGFVSVCDRIIGPDADHGDPQGTGEPDPDAVPRQLTAPAGPGPAGDLARSLPGGGS